MIRHVVMVNFKPEVNQEQQAEFAKKLPGALGQIPGAKNVIVGMASDIEGKPLYSGASFIDFDDEAKLKAYLEHPMHKAVDAQGRSMCSDYVVMNYLC